jgi:hypothetical protein
VTIQFTETKTIHQALTQLFRWYQLYERPITPERIALQLEILDPDIELDMTYGKGKGHDRYLAGVRALPTTEQHSHHVRNAEAKKLDDARIELHADVTYQQLKADGALSSTKLHYTMFLRGTDSGLPIFTKLQVQVLGAAQEATFLDAYPTSRIKSFMHYWLLLMEGIGQSAAPFKELLGKDGFTLHFSSGKEPMTTYEQLAGWHQGVGSQIKLSSHHPKNLQVKVLDEQTFSASVDFDWIGVNLNDKLMTAKTHHDWVLKDTVERFLRMKQATATAVQPFTVVE